MSSLRLAVDARSSPRIRAASGDTRARSPAARRARRRGTHAARARPVRVSTPRRSGRRARHRCVSRERARAAGVRRGLASGQRHVFPSNAAQRRNDSRCGSVPLSRPRSRKRRAHAQKPFLRRLAWRRESSPSRSSDATKCTRVSALSPETHRRHLSRGGQSFSPGAPQPLPAGLYPQRYFLFVGDPIAEPRKNSPALRGLPPRVAGRRGPAPSLVAGARAPALPGVVHAGNFGDDLIAGTGRRRCARCTAAPSRWRSRPITRRSACRCSKRWLAERRSSRRGELAARDRRRCGTLLRRPTTPEHGRSRCGAWRAMRRCAKRCARRDRAAPRVQLGDERATGIWRCSARPRDDRARRRRVELPGDRRGIGRYLRAILRACGSASARASR